MNILKVLTDRRIKGNIAEAAVCKYLKRRKYKILSRNYVADGHEIDIVAEEKEHICFVEVRSRTEGAANPYGTLLRETVDKKKQESIISAARVYSASTGGRKKFRFDVAEVYLTKSKQVKEISYIENAFVLPTYR